MTNIYSFAVKDAALDKQEIVDTLNRLITEHDELKIFPTSLKIALEQRVWESERKFVDMTVIPPCSFHDFIHGKYPYGIGATYEIVENLIRGRNDVLALWTEVTKRKPGEGQARDPETGQMLPKLDNVQDRKIEAPTGNTAAAGLRKLQKAASEGNEKAKASLSEAVEGKKSVHAACVDAGLRKNTRKPPKIADDPLTDELAAERQVARLIDAWNAAGPEARQEFLYRIGSQ